MQQAFVAGFTHDEHDSKFQSGPKIAIRKRRVFSYPVILRGLMRGPQKVIDFLGCPAPKRCPERSEGMTKSPEKRFLFGNFKLVFYLDK
jgi:hypothetical protein